MRGQHRDIPDGMQGSGARSTTRPAAPRRIGVGVDGTPSGRDAVVLAATLAEETRAELMLIAVHEEPLLEGVVPVQVGWASSRSQEREMLARTRDSLAPQARIVVESNGLAWRGLLGVARREHRDLLVVGSSRRAGDGHARLGRDTGELVSHVECPLAIAPRGLRTRSGARLKRIGVGFDATPESYAALGLAGSIALAADAILHVRGIVEDRVAGGLRTEDLVLSGDAIVARQLTSLSERARAAARATGARTDLDVTLGRATDGLRELGERVDLLVIGSGHSGATGRVQLGHTGRKLLGDAPAPILIAPRPRHPAAA